MAITRVQSTTATAVGSTTVGVTWGASPTNGNFLVCVIGTTGGSANRVSSISETGATWVKAVQSDNAGGVSCDIWYALNVSGASTSVTVNLAASLNAAVCFVEYSGIATSGALDQTASDQDDYSNRTPSTGTTATTTYLNELWFGGASDTAGLWLAAGTFTLVTQSNGTGVTTIAGEKIVSTKGTAGFTPSHKIVPIIGPWAGCMSTYSDPNFLTGSRRIIIS